ncbi:hypothetical protein ACFL1X_09525 [Candidatus Hydrogenedentota bacterium]
MFFRQIVIGCLMSMAVCADVQAHSVGADAYVLDDGKTISVEAWFGGGGVPDKGEVHVLLPDDSEYMVGELKDGVFRFAPDVLERFTFNVQLGEGHAKEFVLVQEEFDRLKAGVQATEDIHKLRQQRKSGGLLVRTVLGLLTIGAITGVGMHFAKKGKDDGSVSPRP